MKKTISFFAIILLIKISYAGRGLMGPTCYIEGNIVSLGPDINITFGCDTDPCFDAPILYYSLNLTIKNVSLIRHGDNPNSACSKDYPINSVQQLYVNKEDEDFINSFTLGNKIKGIVTDGFLVPDYRSEECSQDSECPDLNYNLPENEGKYFKCINEKCKIQNKNNECSQDSDCIIVDNTKMLDCCEGCNLINFSLNNYISINKKWRQENKKCGSEPYTCPACLSRSIPENEKWTSKCMDNKCKKVLKNEENNNQNKTFTLSNGRNAEIKIMPETASEKAIERLGELGFNISLKEVGDDKVAYELNAEKEGKFLGIFKVKGKVSAEVDAETGDTKVHKPWWAFLTSGI